MSRDPFTPAQRADLMARVRGKNNALERDFFRILRRSGGRFTSHAPGLPGKPDIVFRRRRVAVFIDGDFWHGRQWRARGLAALEEQFKDSPRRSYWLAKIRRNMARDAAAANRLLESGWTVLRLWESELRRSGEQCAQLVLFADRAEPSPGASLAAAQSVAEFFSGIGLMRLGLEREGWRVAFANDNDESKRRLYTGHFGECPELRGDDIRTLRGPDVPPVTLATASFPCTDLSIAGAQRGLAGDHSSMFWEFVRILNEMEERRPPLVLLENVHGLLTARGGADLEACLRALNDAGYVVDVFALNARHFTPQSRPRLFIVGVLESVAPAADLAPAELTPDELRPPKLVAFMQGQAGIQWRLRRLPAPPECEQRLADVLDDLPDDDPSWWRPERAAYLLNQMGERSAEVAREMIAAQRWSVGAVFRRMRGGKSTAELRTDGIAGCLRTPRGGSARQLLFKAGLGRYAVRLLNPRECARLMGADDFRITGSVSRALFGFGDAVTAPAVAWIARHYLNPVVNELIRGRALRLPGNP